MRQVMVSTSDNPYNPFDEFDKWRKYDEFDKKYYSLSYLARVSHTSIELSEPDYIDALEDAIDDMIRLGGFMNSDGDHISYIKVVRETNEEPGFV